MSDVPARKVRRLMVKSRSGVNSLVFSRLGLIVVLLLLQIGMLFWAMNWFAGFIPHLFGSTLVFNLVMVIILLNSPTEPSAKLTWLAVIMLIPILGSLLYLYTRFDIGHRALKKRISVVMQETRFDLQQDHDVMEQLTAVDPGVAGMVRYTGRCGCHPIWDNTNVTYLPSGEEKLTALLAALEQAKHFIFLEYFIIEEGLMWGQVLEILVDKAQAGVEVRVMIDGTCEFTTLSHDYPQKLEKLGIKCKYFAPATPFVSTHYNYRDHRKIVVIDGRIGFTGGINLADEYINVKKRFGHWKDVGIRLEGDAVRSLSVMFLQMWAIDGSPAEITRFLRLQPPRQPSASGYVMPYSDCPLDGNQVGERVYMDILYRAKRYVHIMTPYLILDSTLENALKYAAERGVDVHLILPGIPDKKAPWWLARTHYASLMASGVKISEYTPGFVHAKVFVCDDSEAVVGTINLDYRSLYHHFECAAYLHSTPCITDIERDFQLTLRQCTRMTEKRLSQIPWTQKFAGAVLKALAPLM